MPRIFSITSKPYGNASKVVPNISASNLAMEKKVYKKTYYEETIDDIQEKKWAKDTAASSVVTANITSVIGREIITKIDAL